MSSASSVLTPQKTSSSQPFLVRRAAVLGAGTMGSRIAAHLANAGIPVLLLDILPRDEKAPRNALALKAIEALASRSRRRSLRRR